MMKRKSEVGYGAFSRFRAREREAKKAKESAKKIGSDERERKKHNFGLFPPSTLEAQFHNPNMIGRGKSKGLE